MSVRSPGVRRLMQEAKELNQPTDMYVARPLEDNLFEWHFTIKGPPDTPYEGGLYHGRIILPDIYPHKPPNFVLLTPSGRFEINTKICLSISSYHPETWLPSWSIGTALVALVAFMNTPGKGAVGSLECSDQQRKKLAKESLNWTCHACGCKMSDVLKEMEAHVGNKPVAELPPMNPDAAGDSKVEDAPETLAQAIPETVSVEPAPVPQVVHENVEQQVVNSPSFTFLIFFFLALLLGLICRRLISVQ